MSGKVWPGESWKSADDAPRKVVEVKRTRLQEQAFIDTEFAYGRLTTEAWRARCDELSDLQKWNGAGRVVKI